MQQPFLVDDANCLSQVSTQLDEVLQVLESHTPKDKGLPLCASPVKKNLKVTKIDYHQVFHKPLPLRRKRKHVTKNYREYQAYRTRSIYITRLFVPRKGNTLIPFTLYLIQYEKSQCTFWLNILRHNV